MMSSSIIARGGRHFVTKLTSPNPSLCPGPMAAGPYTKHVNFSGKATKTMFLRELSISAPISQTCSVRRRFSSTPIASHNPVPKPPKGEELHITVIDKEGVSHKFEVPTGANILDICQDNDIEMEGACGGVCACSTCHLYVSDDEMYDRLPEPTDDENDMLDQASELRPTSRLGCQVSMSKGIDGLEVRLPSSTRNMQASDFEERRRMVEEKLGG